MSYTRSGRRYKGSFEMSEETARAETTDVQQVLQMLLEDRRKRRSLPNVSGRRGRQRGDCRRCRSMWTHYLR